jgi:hypothetical protein
MERMLTTTADDLDLATSALVDPLRAVLTHDWTALAVPTDRTCWQTAEHIGDCLLSYAAQMAVRPEGRYVRFMANADADATPSEVLEVAEAGARILASTVRTAAPDLRAHHPLGLADPAGWAGMGCVEVLVHGQDIARGLGVVLDPPREVCNRVLARMFPEVDAADEDPWSVLLWATGRIDLPGREPVRTWKWRAAPLGE